MEQELNQEMKDILKNTEGKERELIEKYLFELSNAYQPPAELDKCLETLAEIISNLLGVESVSMVLKEDEANLLLLRIKRTGNGEREVIKDNMVREEEFANSVTGWVWNRGEPLLVEDIARDGRFISRKGNYYNNSLLSVPLKNEDRVIGVVHVNNKISRDVFRTEDLHQLSKLADFCGAVIEIAHQQKRDKAMDKIRHELLSHISHEFKVPITVVDEVMDIFSSELSNSLSERQKRLFSLAKQSLQRLKRMIEEWLNYARKNGTMKLAEKAKFFDIISTTKHVIYSLDILARNKGVVIKGLFPPNSELKIWANEDEITQVLVNLLHNAIKYNKENGTVEVSFEISEKKDLLKIYISDTGVGIAPENQEKIFHKYASAEIMNGDNLESHGLGLYISREIVRKHGGEISVSSELGKGSVFVVSLPQKKQPLEYRGG
ncbi:MAG: ATP-binding protein [Candidatus Omnitrophota bacterium]